MLSYSLSAKADIWRFAPQRRISIPRTNYLASIYN